MKFWNGRRVKIIGLTVIIAMGVYYVFLNKLFPLTIGHIVMGLGVILYVIGSWYDKKKAW